MTTDLPARRPTRLGWRALPWLAGVLGGCASAPPYHAPTVVEAAAAFREAPPGWLLAAPADALERGPWWQLFADPTLDALASRVDVANLTVAASAAAYAQAEALLREQRAARWPTLSANGGVSRAGGPATAAAGNRFQAGVSASWDADLWGRLTAAVAAAGASAEASAADLAAARLSVTGALASNYFSLRQSDADARLLRSTLEAYRRSLQITQNRYDAGVAPKSDVLQAQTQFANAEADLAGVLGQRAQLEHAIAVLVGESPSAFALAEDAGSAAVLPALPLGVPSALLQRRPDVAAAERRVAAANAQIGVARAALFPSFGLSGDYGLSSGRLPDLFQASAAAWSLGLSVAQTVFDAGANRARIDESRAAWEQTQAQYRQTVLASLQEVEDQLAAGRALEQQLASRRQASDAAEQTAVQVENRYRAGQVGYSEVAQAQLTALAARRSVVQLAGQRQTAAVALIQALGGGWSSASIENAGAAR